MDESSNPTDHQINIVSLVKSGSVSALINIESDREVVVYNVDVDLRNKTFEVTSPGGELDEPTQEAISSAVQKALGSSMSPEDFAYLESCAAPALVIPDNVVELEDANGWSSSPHALSAIAKAARMLGGGNRTGYLSNPAWEGSED